MDVKTALSVFFQLPVDQKWQLLKFLWSRQSWYTKTAVLGGFLAVLWQLREAVHSLCEKSLTSKVAVVTGAGSGIGRLISIGLAKEGCRVALWDINLPNVEKVAEEIRALGGQAMPYKADVSSRDAVYSVAAETQARFGKVDILVNNAGIVSGKDILKVNDELAVKTMEVNTISHFWTVKAFLPAMMEQNSGHIVTVASAAGMCGIAGMEDYCASKFGAVGFDESLRNELKKLGKTGVKTTCVCPYYINTGMFDGVKSPILPILEPDYVAFKILRAIKRNQEVLCMPRIVYVVPACRALLPVWLFDAAASLLGLNSSMDHFKGNSKSIKRD